MSSLQHLSPEQRQVLEKEAESQVAINNLAMLLATYRQDQESLDRAKQLAERLRNSQNPTHIDTLGWVYVQRGEIDAAIPLLVQAAFLVPDASEFQYHLGAAYHINGEPEAAARHLEQALAPNEYFPGVEDARARLDALKGKGGYQLQSTPSG